MKSIVNYPSIQQAFVKQARQTPDKVAVAFGDVSFTYDELDQQSHGLMMHLRSLGVKPADVIGIHMDRHPNVIVAMLAVLKCGAAYLPLDKVNPVSRNQCHIVECEVNLVITDTTDEYIDQFGVQLVRPATLNLSTDFSNVNLSDAIPYAGDAEDVAYVMFTSGSTGKPKGVVVPHRSVMRLVQDQDYIEIDPSDNIMQFSSLSFDAATFEIWGALLNGACLVLYSGGGLDPNRFKDELETNNVTILFITTALFHLIAHRFIDALSNLKTLLTGGDVLYPSMVNKVADTYPDLNLIICYGPTENTTFTTTYPITDTNRPETSVPIGKAIRGTEVHVLRDDLSPCEIGEEGELFTSGDGVALGYLNKPQSPENFFQNDQIQEGLIYRTGDIVKLNSQGYLEFVGRKDNQVKIRGFRASTEEIQKTVANLTEVKDAVVLLKKYDNGDQQLMAYILLNDGFSASGSELKNALKKTIPDYMVPDRMIIKNDFPINKNGKICKATLEANLV